MKLKVRKRILSVDWDAFYQGVHQSEGYEWSAEQQGLEQIVWYVRAGAHLANERRIMAKEFKPQSFLPRLYGVNPRAWAFWPLITWRKRVSLYGADSHKDIWPHLELWAGSTDDMSKLTIVNVDAHHDMGYGVTRTEGAALNCGNWAVKAAFRGAHIEQVYIEPPADGRYQSA